MEEMTEHCTIFAAFTPSKTESGGMNAIDVDLITRH